jgi:hypothetical protein
MLGFVIIFYDKYDKPQKKPMRSKKIFPYRSVGEYYYSEAMIRMNDIRIISYKFMMLYCDPFCRQSSSDENAGKASRYSGKTIFVGSFILILIEKSSHRVFADIR